MSVAFYQNHWTFAIQQEVAIIYIYSD